MDAEALKCPPGHKQAHNGAKDSEYDKGIFHKELLMQDDEESLWISILLLPG